MNESTTTVESPPPAAEPSSASTAPAPSPTHRAISDPREVAKVVMARLNQVSAKKDELALAINALADLARQLTRTYAEQQLTIEQLRRRVKTLEDAALATGEPPARLS